MRGRDAAGGSAPGCQHPRVGLGGPLQSELDRDYRLKGGQNGWASPEFPWALSQGA